MNAPAVALVSIIWLQVEAMVDCGIKRLIRNGIQAITHVEYSAHMMGIAIPLKPTYGMNLMLNGLIGNAKSLISHLGLILKLTTGDAPYANQRIGRPNILLESTVNSAQPLLVFRQCTLVGIVIMTISAEERMPAIYTKIQLRLRKLLGQIHTDTGF